MKLDGIAAFVTVAESGSISEAARRLRLSKSVVSERLNELEKSLGAPLLHRTTRKLSLTEDGTAFLTRANRIMTEVKDAAADLAERRGELAGPLRLAAPVTFGRLHLGPALYPFLKRHPAIELTLDLDDRRVDAAGDGYDAVLRHGQIQDTRLMAWRLANSRRVLTGSADYFATHGRPKDIADLENHRGIFYTNRGVDDWRFVSNGETRVVRAQAALRVNNGDMILEAAKAGLGLALLPMFIAGPALKAGEIEALDLGCPPDEEFIFLAHPDGRNPSAKLRALADHLRQAFGTPPYWDVT